MADHYFTSKPSSKQGSIHFHEVLRDRKFAFISNAGVFSKAGIDYGSRLLIENMELTQGSSVLDVGCGYGPIGLVAASLNPSGMITMVDVNERALQLARENARENGIANVRILKSDGLEQVKQERYQTILTNPPIRAGKDVVHGIFREARECLDLNGQLWVVIRKQQGAPSAYALLENLFGEGNVDVRTKDKGYRIFCATRKNT